MVTLGGAFFARNYRMGNQRACFCSLIEACGALQVKTTTIMQDGDANKDDKKKFSNDATYGLKVLSEKRHPRDIQFEITRHSMLNNFSLKQELQTKNVEDQTKQLF